MRNAKKYYRLAPFAMLWFSIALTFVATFILNLDWLGGVFAFAFIFTVNMALDIVWNKFQNVS